MERMLTTRQVAEMFGVKKETIRRWRRQGKLQSVGTGEKRRYPMTSVQTALQKAGEE